MSSVKKIKLLIVIVDRGYGEDVSNLLRKCNVTFNMVSPGHGASGTGFADYLGITSSEKDIVISVLLEEMAISVLEKLQIKYNMDQPGNGIAFTLPIAGVSGPLALKYMSGFALETKEEQK